MNQADLNPFTEALADMLAVLSHGRHAPEAGAVRVWFRTLQPYTLGQVLAGFDGHMRSPASGRTLPIPSDIVAQIVGAAAKDGRPDGDEAWAIVAPAASEAATVVWSAEMAEAWGAVLPLVCAGDMVAARKSFLAAYARLVDEARSHGRRLEWSAALGHDKAGQADAIRIAAQKGRLAGGAADEALRLAGLPSPTQALARLAGGPSQAVSQEAKAKAMAALKALRDQFSASDDQVGIVDDSGRRKAQERRAHLSEAVAKYVGRA